MILAPTAFFFFVLFFFFRQLIPVPRMKRNCFCIQSYVGTSGCTVGGDYVPGIYSHARWSYRRRFRSLMLCPLSVERYYIPLFVDFSSKLYLSVWLHI